MSNEVIFEEYDRLKYNYNVCLLGFKAICEYCKDKAIPTDDIMIIGNIIENVFDELKNAPKEVKNNDKDWGFGEKNWHLEIRDLPKCYLVHLIEDIKVKYQLTDSDMNELVINLKNPLDKRVSV